jgi:hypothetical protein
MSLTLNGVIKEIKEYEFTIVDEYGNNEVKFRQVDNLLKNCNIGLLVEVKFNVKGNQHNEKYYISLDAFKVSKADSFKAKQDAPQVDKLVI